VSDGCVFCDIADGRAPAYIVAENDLAYALLDIQPLSAGHCLVVPRRHEPWWDDLSEAEVDAVFRLAGETARRIRAVFSPDMVTMYVRGRRVPHAHVFLVPTFAGDPLDRVFNGLEGFQEQADALATLRDPGELRATWEKLKNA
jgi:histidine triad (HIT) family protein